VSPHDLREGAKSNISASYGANCRTSVSKISLSLAMLASVINEAHRQALVAGLGHMADELLLPSATFDPGPFESAALGWTQLFPRQEYWEPTWRRF